MITDAKINNIQRKIQEAIANIAKEENVTINFESIRYNASHYTSRMKVTTNEKTPEVKKINKSVSSRYGFKQDIVGMEFESGGKIHKIIDIKTRNRKYPIITECNDGKSYKFGSDRVKSLIGGNKVVNRNANLSELLD